VGVEDSPAPTWHFGEDWSESKAVHPLESRFDNEQHIVEVVYPRRESHLGKVWFLASIECKHMSQCVTRTHIVGDGLNTPCVYPLLHNEQDVHLSRLAFSALTHFLAVKDR